MACRVCGATAAAADADAAAAIACCLSSDRRSSVVVAPCTTHPACPHPYCPAGIPSAFLRQQETEILAALHWELLGVAREVRGTLHHPASRQSVEPPCTGAVSLLRLPYRLVQSTRLGGASGPYMRTSRCNCSWPRLTALQVGAVGAPDLSDGPPWTSRPSWPSWRSPQCCALRSRSTRLPLLPLLCRKTC